MFYKTLYWKFYKQEELIIITCVISRKTVYLFIMLFLYHKCYVKPMKSYQRYRYRSNGSQISDSIIQTEV